MIKQNNRISSTTNIFAFPSTVSLTSHSAPLQLKQMVQKGSLPLSATVFFHAFTNFLDVVQCRLQKMKLLRPLSFTWPCYFTPHHPNIIIAVTHPPICSIISSFQSQTIPFFDGTPVYNLHSNGFLTNILICESQVSEI